MKKRNLWMMLLAVVIMASCWGLKAKAASSLLFEGDDVHDGTVGLDYVADLNFYAYSDGITNAKVSSGTLPPGLSCKFENGLGLKSEQSIVRISGTPTKAGTYSFKITVTGGSGKTITSSQYTVIICSSGTTFKLTLTGCTAEADGKEGIYFRAGEDVTLTPKNLAESEYVYSWKNDGGLSICTGSEMDYSIGLNRSFSMPAKNVSIECVKKSKDRGTYTHDAAAAGPDNTCSKIEVMSLGISNQSVIKVKENERLDETGYWSLFYSYIDLDKDGTIDLEVLDKSCYLIGPPPGGEVCHIKAVEGRSVYGTWTIEIPKKTLYSNPSSSCDALYSKIVLNMGVAPCPKSSTGHKIKGIDAKAPTCTKDGYKWHYECTECGQWFTDAAGKTPITNKASYTLKAMGHKWSDWYVAKEATETAEGVRERVCYNNKNHKEQEAIPKLEPAPTTEAPATEAPTTEAPTTEAPTTAEPTTEAPTEPETTAAPIEPETTAAPTEPETTAAPTQAPTEAPTQAPTEAPKPTEPAAPEKSGGNTILYVLLGVTTAAAALMGGILIGKRSKGKDSK